MLRTLFLFVALALLAACTRKTEEEKPNAPRFVLTGDTPERHNYITAEEAEARLAQEQVDAAVNINLVTGEREVIKGSLDVINPETGERTTYHPGDEVPNLREWAQEMADSQPQD